MKISKSEYLLAKVVYLNFFVNAAKGTKCETPEQLCGDNRNGNDTNIGKAQSATLNRCARIIREYEAQLIEHQLNSDTIISIDPATGEGVILQRINPICTNDAQKITISQPIVKYVGDITKPKK
jgi:hypothetical protein